MLITNTVLDTLPIWQLGLLALCFVWSGVVRSGLGFGGAALSLPLMLLIVDDLLLFLPAIGFHLLFFSVLTIATRRENINWQFLSKLCAVMAIPFCAGLIGLLNISGTVLSLFVYAITLIYAASYIVNKTFVSHNRFTDFAFLVFGGYVSGVSLIGAPLIVALGIRRLPAHQLRETFFTVWIVMVLFKLGTFAVADVDLQIELTLLTFPAVAVGHFIGLRVHAKIIRGDQTQFQRFIGFGLATVSIIGLVTIINKLM